MADIIWKRQYHNSAGNGLNGLETIWNKEGTAFWGVAAKKGLVFLETKWKFKKIFNYLHCCICTFPLFACVSLLTHTHTQAFHTTHTHTHSPHYAVEHCNVMLHVGSGQLWGSNLGFSLSSPISDYRFTEASVWLNLIFEIIIEICARMLAGNQRIQLVEVSRIGASNHKWAHALGVISRLVRVAYKIKY